MRIRAPAKINLRLRVVGRRDDGYHLIDTILAPVSLYDEVEITRARPVGATNAISRRLIVTCDSPDVPEGAKNIAYQAAQLMIRSGAIKETVTIHIRKRIPVGAGLGGGSSDAAATLIGLNRLFDVGYSPRKLKTLASLLGADVPFFIHGRPARARGIGERLSPIPQLPQLSALILYPGFPVATAWVYRQLRIKLTKPDANTSITTLIKKPIDFGKLLVNDLEMVTLARYPRIVHLKAKLLAEGAEGALMSGSGSAVFGLFTSRNRAKQALGKLRKEEGVQAFLVRLLS